MTPSAAAAAARALADELNPEGLIGTAELEDGADFVATSKSRPWIRYPIDLQPEGYAVHQGEGCEGEIFNGPIKCWHSKQLSSKEQIAMTQALVRAEGVLSPAPIEFNDEQLAVIKQSIAKGATDTELQLFVATCRRTGLDPFLKQIYAIKRWDSRERKEVMGIQVGIDGMRLIAERTGKYAGQDATEYLDEDGAWSEVWLGEGNPVAARSRVYRKDWDRPAVAICRWDSYAQIYVKDNRTHLMPNWASMPDVMLGKCAESLALRRAFPAEMSALAVALGGENTSYDPAEDGAPLDTVPEREYIDAEVVNRNEAPQEADSAATPVGDSPRPATPPEPSPAPTPAPARRTPRAQQQPPAGPDPDSPLPEKPRQIQTTDDDDRAAAIGSFWAATREAPAIPQAVTFEKSRELFAGRDPAQLTPQERIQLLAVLRQPAATPAVSAGPASPEDHKAATGHDNQTYTPEGDFVCGDCQSALLDAA